MDAERRSGNVYVMEYARSKDQPWVDLISGMYHGGVMDLPFSFILAQRGDRNVLVDTGFMQDEHSSGFSRKFGIPTWISPLTAAGGDEPCAARRSPTSSSPTPTSITWARSPSFPNAHIYIQKSELLSWYEAVRAARSGSAHLTAIVDPDNMRAALDASIAASRDADRRRQGQCPARHSRAARERAHDRPAIRGHRDEGGPAGDLGRLRLLAAPVHRPQQRRRLRAAQQRRRQRLGAAQDDRQDE